MSTNNLPKPQPSIIPKPRYSNINTVLLGAFFNKYKSLFADPLLYSTALGVWTYNIFMNSRIEEIGEDFSLILVKSQTPLLGLFWNTASHYFNVTNDKHIYEDISASHIEEFITDLKRTTDVAYDILNTLFMKLDRRITRMMYNQYTIWVLGVLYGFYAEEMNGVAEMVLSTYLPTIKILRGEINEKQVLQNAYGKRENT